MSTDHSFYWKWCVEHGGLANSTALLLFRVGCSYGREWVGVASDMAMRVMAMEALSGD